MEFKTSIYPNYLIYKKEKEDILKNEYFINVMDIKLEIIDMLKSTLDNTEELMYKHNNAPVLRDELYTNGNKVYSKEELNNIGNLLTILKENPIYPLIDDGIINEPILYKNIYRYSKSGIITNEYDYDLIANELVKDLIKVTLLDNNADKSYITDSFGLTYDNKPVFLEEEFMLDDIAYSYHIVDKFENELNVKDKVRLFTLLNELSTNLFKKVITILDKTDIRRYSIETSITDNTLIINTGLPYSSLRAKVTKYLLNRR